MTLTNKIPPFIVASQAWRRNRSYIKHFLTVGGREGGGGALEHNPPPPDYTCLTLPFFLFDILKPTIQNYA